MSREGTVPTEQQRAIHALISGALLGLVLALAARRRWPRATPANVSGR